MRKFSPTALRLAVIVLWVALFGLLLERDYFVRTLDLREAQVLKRSREESFQGIYFKKERIGYVKNRLVAETADRLTLHQQAYMRLNILNESHPVQLAITAHMSPDFLLRDFDFTLTSPFYEMAAEGEVEGRTVRFRITTGKETIDDAIELDRPPYLATNLRGYLIDQGLEKGDKIRVPYFDPISLAGKDTVMEYQGLDKILVSGRIYRLHHFIETFAGVRINSWLDDEGRVIKEESPAGFVFLAEPEFKATAIAAKGKEILSTVSVKPKGTMPADLAHRKRLRFRLTLPEGTAFDLSQGRQRFANGILTVERQPLPALAAAACQGPAEALASTPYIQAKNSRITALAASLVKKETPPLAKVEQLADWVYENLEKRPVLGIPDALTTLETRRGDCNEHAALFAALARNVGIPTRVAAGVTFHQGAFYYHAWNEVCIDGRWLSLDTTKNQLPADLTHIKFVDGETEEMLKIAALIGKLEIEILPGEGSRP